MKVSTISVPYVAGCFAPGLGSCDGDPEEGTPQVAVLSSYNALEFNISAGNEFFIGMNGPMFNSTSPSNTTTAGAFMYYTNAAAGTVSYTTYNPLSFANATFTASYSTVRIAAIETQVIFNHPPLSANCAVTYAVTDGAVADNDNTGQANVLFLTPNTISKLAFARATSANATIDTNKNIIMRWVNTNRDENLYAWKSSSAVTNTYNNTGGWKLSMSNITGGVTGYFKVSVFYNATVDPNVYNILGMGKMPTMGPMTDKFFDVLFARFPLIRYYPTAYMESLVGSFKSSGEDDADVCLSLMQQYISSHPVGI